MPGSVVEPRESGSAVRAASGRQLSGGSGTTRGRSERPPLRVRGPCGPIPAPRLISSVRSHGPQFPQRQQTLRRCRAADSGPRRGHPAARPGRVRRAGGPQRLRQDDVAQPGRRRRPAVERGGRDRRGGDLVARRRRADPAAPHADRVRVPVPATSAFLERGGERGAAAAARGRAPGAPPGVAPDGAGGSRASRRPPAAPVVGGTDAVRGHRPGAGARPGPAAGRRADGQARHADRGDGDGPAVRDP